MDSSAWLEYLRGTPAGNEVKKIIENKDNAVFTPNIVAAEVISKMLRNGEEPTDAINAISTISIPPKEEQSYYFEAGEEHFKLKNIFKEISLADAIIKVLSEKNGSKLITKDFHLKGKNTVFIG